MESPKLITRVKSLNKESNIINSNKRLEELSNENDESENKNNSKIEKNINKFNIDISGGHSSFDKQNRKRTNLKSKAVTNNKPRINATLSNIEIDHNFALDLAESADYDNRMPEKNYKNKIKDLNFSQVNLREKRNNKKSSKSLEDLFPFEYETAKSKKSKTSIEKNNYVKNNQKEIEMETIKYHKKEHSKSIVYRNSDHENINEISSYSSNARKRKNNSHNIEEYYSNENEFANNNDKLKTQPELTNDRGNNTIIPIKKKNSNNLNDTNYNKIDNFMKKETRNELQKSSALYHSQQNNNCIETQNLIIKNYEEKQEYQKLKNNEIFISKIDKIYEFIEKSNMQKNPFSFQILIVFLINLINIMFFWVFYYIISDNKNNFYCYDRNSSTIVVCYEKEFCGAIQDGPPNIAYLEDDIISNDNELFELLNINKYFRANFILDSLRFSSWNPMSHNRTNIGPYAFNIVLGISKNENWNLFVYYNLVCSKARVLTLFALVMALAFIVFSIFISFCADIYGRKPILMLLVFLQIAGLLILSFFDTQMINKINTLPKETEIIYSNKTFTRNEDIYNSYSKNAFNDNDQSILNIEEKTNIIKEQMFFNETIYKSNTSILIDNFQLTLTPVNGDIARSFNFSISNLSKEYQMSFLYFHYQKLKAKIKREFFLNNMVLFLIGLFLSFGVIPVIFNLSLALIMESSLNLSSCLENYKFFNLSYIFAFIIPYFLLDFFDSFKIVLIIFAILQFSFLIVYILAGMESPRYLYEISDWYRIKDIVNNMLVKKYFKKSEIDNFIKNENDLDLKREIIQENRWKSIQKFMGKSILLSLNWNKFEKFEKKYKAGLIEKIKFQKMLKIPFLTYYLIFKNKTYKQYNLVVLSLVFNLSITLFLIQNKFSSDLIISRQVLYNSSSAYWFNIFNFFILFAANYLFLWLEQIWGYPIVMSLCYFFIFIFSLVLAVGNIRSDVKSDLNKNSIGKTNYYENPNNNNNIILFYFCSFFVHGLFFPFFIYITKFTRTIYRSSFYGFIHMIIFSIWMISVPLTQFFANNYFFLCLSSLVGFFISYFVVNNQDEILVQDFRRLVIDEK